MSQVGFLEESSGLKLDGEDLKSSWGEDSREGDTKLSLLARVCIS